MDKEISTNLYKVLDISMGNITESDAALLSNSEAPNRSMEEDEGIRSLYFVGAPIGGRDAKLKDFGFSDALINIFKEADKTGARFILFDPQADIIESLPTFDW